MIHFMPFTHITESLIDRLYAVFGPVSICQPLSSLASPVMQQAAAAGRLQVCAPGDIDQVRLRQSLQDFNHWAASHQGRSGDLVGFFRSQQMQTPGRGAGREEADAHRIHDQLRRRADGAPRETADPMFEAALFLCLAHTYDLQQEALNLDLGKVQALEAHFGRILGEPDAQEASIGPPLPSFADDRAHDRGAYMTRRRLASWARMALPHADIDSGFVTSSAAVMADIQERWPEIRLVAQRPVRLPASGGAHEAALAPELVRTGFLSLCRAEDPVAAAVDLFKGPAAEEPGTTLTVYAVQGCPPRDFLSEIIDKKQTDMGDIGDPSPPRNTVIGHIAG